MGDAMKQGFSQIVGDISGGITSQTDVDSYGSMIAPEPAVNSRISQKRIPMPAGFPHSAYASSSSNTPLQTPGLSQVRRPSHQPGITQPSFSSAQSTHRIPQAARQARTTSTAPSIAGQSQSNFRFRGQFASQPGTPGPAIGSGMYSEAEARRVGVLNSRAG